MSGVKITHIDAYKDIRWKGFSYRVNSDWFIEKINFHRKQGIICECVTEESKKYLKGIFLKFRSIIWKNNSTIDMIYADQAVIQ